MKKAYIILAHKYPDQLCRLISRLDDNNATFFIHVDKKTPLQLFSCLQNFGRKVQLVDRIQSGWGTFGLVQSTISLFRSVLASRTQFEMIHFLSGQDYPIKSNEEIDTFFSNSPYSIFLSYFSLPNFERWEDGGGMWRANKYFFGMEKKQLLMSRALNLTATALPFLKRKVPEDMQLYLGSQWFSINLEAVAYIVDFIDSNPQYVDYHKKGFGADEMFFLMILLNAKDENIKSKIQNDNLRFMIWETVSTASPETLVMKNYDDIQHSEALFARKFDLNVDTEVLDRIDKELLIGRHHEPQAGTNYPASLHAIKPAAT